MVMTMPKPTSAIPPIEELIQNQERYAFLDHIRVGDIIADHSYQRDLPEKSRLELMSKTWDDRLAGVILLSYRDGQMYVIDGQSRVKAKTMAHGPDAVIPAMIYVDLNVEQEAKLFDEIRRRQRVLSAIDTYKARLAYHEPIAVEIKAICDSLGLTISKAPNHWNDVTAFAAMESVYVKHSPNVLRNVMVTLRDAFPEQTRAFVSSNILGLALFWVLYDGKMDPGRVRDRLAQITPTQMLQRVQIMVGAGKSHMQSQTAWCYAMHDLYNSGLRVKRLPNVAEMMALRMSRISSRSTSISGLSGAARINHERKQARLSGQGREVHVIGDA